MLYRTAVEFTITCYANMDGFGIKDPYVTVFGKTNRLARKTNFFFIALLPFISSEDTAVQF